jgi:hypothetical protein
MTNECVFCAEQHRRVVRAVGGQSMQIKVREHGLPLIGGKSSIYPFEQWVRAFVTPSKQMTRQVQLLQGRDA